MSAQATGCHSIKSLCSRNRKSLPQIKHVSFLACCICPFSYVCLLFHVFGCPNLLNSTTATVSGSQELYSSHGALLSQQHGDCLGRCLRHHIAVCAHTLLAMLACSHSAQPTCVRDIKSSFLLSILHCSQVKSAEAVINTALKASDSVTVIDLVIIGAGHRPQAAVTTAKLGTDLHLGGHKFH